MVLLSVVVDDINIVDVVEVLVVDSNFIVGAAEEIVLLVVFGMVEVGEVVFHSLVVLSGEVIFDVVDVSVVDVVISADVVVDSVNGIVTRRRFWK